MTGLFGASAIALLSFLVGGGLRQQTAAPAAAPDTIGLVKQITGEWFIEGKTPRRLTYGQELPTNARLVAGRFTGQGADTRAISLAMYDGSERSFKCSEPATCDGLIPVSIEPNTYISLIRAILQKLYPTKLTPLIIGMAQPGGILELKQGQVEIHVALHTLTSGKSITTRALFWCEASDNNCERIDSSAPIDGSAVVSQRVAKPGLYYVKPEGSSIAATAGKVSGLGAWSAAKAASTSASGSSTNPPSYFLAVASDQYADLANTYTALNEMPVFSTLSESEHNRARVLLLQSLSDAVKKQH